MTEEELTKLREEKFQQAYDMRFDETDISVKPTRRKNRQTGQMEEGKPLAYLNWAVAQRAFLQIYPDGEWGVIETPENSPLWNINGYGMLKLYAEALGKKITEYYPLMDGGMNDSMKVETIDGRDISDSIQRGFTKLFARFGIGLYIYEGKLSQAKMDKTIAGLKKREKREARPEPSQPEQPKTPQEAAVEIQKPPKPAPTVEELEKAAKDNQNPPSDELLKTLRLLYAKDGKEDMYLRNELFFRSKSKEWVEDFINKKKGAENG